MKAFIFSDLHVNFKALDNLKRYFETKREIDLIIFAGDVVNMGEPVSFMEQFVKVVKNIGLPFLWVPGNNDFGRSYYKLKAAFPSLESQITTYKSIKLAGVGGSPASWAGQYAGEKLVDKKIIGGTIFVSHVPPPGLLNYQKFDPEISTPAVISNDPSRLDRSEMEARNPITAEIKGSSRRPDTSGLPQDDNRGGRRLSDSPLVHICGHIHHQWGVAYLGTTKVIKLAAFELGYYGIMDTENLSVEFKRF